MKRSLLVGTALFVLSSGLAVTPAEANNFKGVGLGSTPAQWKAAWGIYHGKNICMTGNACYGPPVYNYTVGVAVMFTDVTFQSGITTNFEINLSNNTHFANALHAAKYLMPPDSKYASLHIYNAGPGSSCAVMQGSSATLSKEIVKAGFRKDSLFNFEFYGQTSDQSVQFFKTADVQTVLMNLGPVNPGSC